MELPTPIAHLSELLSALPEDLRGFILNITKQLSPLIHGHSQEYSSGEIEPDGINGLSNTANYERLMLSEWAMQEVFPEEFLRRAATGEHLFYDVKRQQPEENKTCYVLFDCGPEQLGKPRILQLALLILFARRAEKKNMSLKWGVLQDNSNTWHQDLTKVSVKLWLSKRSANMLTQPQLDKWITSITDENEDNDSELPASADDLWLISNTDLHTPPLATRIKIEEDLLDPSMLEVAVDSKAYSKSLALSLAEEDLCVRIIRDPFAQEKRSAIDAELDISGGWAYSKSGHRLAVKAKSGELFFHQIGRNSTKRKKVDTVFSPPEGQTILSLYMSKKQSVVLTSSIDKFYFHNYPNNGQVFSIDRKQFIASGDSPLSNLVLIKEEVGKNAIYNLSQQKELRRLELGKGQTLFEKVDDKVIALGSLINCSYYVCYKDKSKIEVLWYLGAHHPSRQSFNINFTNKTPQVYAHGSGPWHKGSIGCMAFENNDNQWTLITGTQTKNVNIDEGDTVIGVLSLYEKIQDMKPKQHTYTAVIVTIDKDLKRVKGIASNGRHFHYPLQSEFICGEINPRNPFLQYLDKENELVIIDLMSGEEIQRFSTGGLA